MKPRTLVLAASLVMPLACSDSGPAARLRQTHSSTIAVSPDGSRLYVVHPDADSVSILDVSAHAVLHEILLADAPPRVDPTTRRFDPTTSPRALALDSMGQTLFVTGERSGRLYAIDTAAATIRGSVAVCSEPVGVLVSADNAKVFVACSQDDSIAEIDASSLSVVASVPVPRKPWSLAWAADGHTLLTTHLLGPGVSRLESEPLSLAGTWQVPDHGPEKDSTVPHGQVRGIYDVQARPGTNEIWVAHMMLGVDTPQPDLVFDNTVFPAVSILDDKGAQLARLSVQASTPSPDDGGAFGDVVSGPRSLTFSADGKFAFVVDADSEDLLVVDATRRIETAIVRPLPGHLPEGVVWHDNHVYVQERNTEDVIGFDVGVVDGALTLVPDGPAWKSLAVDPMPANLRLGQKLFYSANSDDQPITQNHWVACATCHVEGRSDAVTWLFEQGPRDTPSNAVGILDTGFLFRTGDRAKVQDYWRTINVEQGGAFHPGGVQQPLLDAIADYVGYAIPIPVPPKTDPALVAKGVGLFYSLGCGSCHSGPAGTDSGLGNPTLDLGGKVVLHDVGTCVGSGPWPDVAHSALDGNPRAACAFDTPALRGLVDSAPYLHDGSAATLDDVIPIMLRASGAPPDLADADRKALVEYLRSL